MRKYFTKQYQKKKRYLRLQSMLSDIEQLIRDLGWEELETPIFKGWEIKLSLRDDIKNREDAWLFQASKVDISND